MRWKLVSLAVLLACALSWAQSPAALSSAPYYLIIENDVTVFASVPLAEIDYLKAGPVLEKLGLTLIEDELGYVLRGNQKEMVFSKELTYFTYKNHLVKAEPPPRLLNEDLYFPAVFINDYFHDFSSKSFVLTQTAPSHELVSVTVGMRFLRGGVEFTLLPPVPYKVQSESGEVVVFFERSRLKVKQENTIPPDWEVGQMRTPLGDQLRFSRVSGAPLAYELIEGENGFRLDWRGEAALKRVLKNRPLQHVILDPGHGGAASGAVGPGGVEEKRLVLEVALKLRDRLEARGLRVTLTRETDMDLSLEARSEFANSRGGDLFVSIHANASLRKSARGAETYFLSYEALDDESRQVALLENAASSTLSKDPLALLLWNLVQSKYLDDSSLLGEEIQRRFNRTLDTPDRGVKQAPLMVLMGTAMPAVLVEIGFISNPTEARLLQQDDYQNRIAEALAESIAVYKQQWDRKHGVEGKSIVKGAVLY